MWSPHVGDKAGKGMTLDLGDRWGKKYGIGVARICMCSRLNAHVGPMRIVLLLVIRRAVTAKTGLSLHRISAACRTTHSIMLRYNMLQMSIHLVGSS